MNYSKVIKGMECHLGNDKNNYDCDNCPYSPMNTECDAKLADDALALLKAQEPVKMVKLHNTETTFRDEIVFEYACPNCYSYLMKTWKACPVCGRAVKWE